MGKEDSVVRPDEEENDAKTRRRHPLTMSNSREETIWRMRAFPERAAKFRERLRRLRESRADKDS